MMKKFLLIVCVCVFFAGCSSKENQQLILELEKESQILREENKNLDKGSIILLHNGSKYTRDALDTTLTNLEQAGYHFVPLSEMIYTSDYYIDHTGKQFLKNKNNE